MTSMPSTTIPIPTMSFFDVSETIIEENKGNGTETEIGVSDSFVSDEECYVGFFLQCPQYPIPQSFRSFYVENGMASVSTGTTTDSLVSASNVFVTPTPVFVSPDTPATSDDGLKTPPATKAPTTPPKINKKRAFDFEGYMSIRRRRIEWDF